MTEALQAVLRYGFTEMGLNRICCEYYHDNEASGRVMQKCGMQFEGTQRQKVFLHRKFVDSHMYAILREDFFHSHT
jgi:ribosomal-protein-alanine N-acetyltransferase